MGVHNIKSSEEFDTITSDESLVVIHFSADWAAQCKDMSEIMKELASDPELKNVRFAELQAEDLPELSSKFKIIAVPVFLIVRSGKVVGRVEGANSRELTQQIKICVHKFSPAPAVSLDDKLKGLVNKARVMLFIKGNRKAPKCGFSRQIIEILDSIHADYETFDILSDNEVREGLKKYSNWPTYPQLYINGELVGGVDIIKEMASVGELSKMIPQTESGGIEKRLKELINKSPIMVFMKGNRTTPRCGFSRKLIEILNETNLDFETFDILEDEVVRQELKEFSKWPTYPQVYVKGELIGGLDIIQELKNTGELISSLKAE